MYNDEQIVPVKLANHTYKHYKDLGYDITDKNQVLLVRAKDLTSGSQAVIEVTCDYCGNNFCTKYSIIQNGRKTFPKDACSKCAGKKASDSSYFRRSEKYFKMLEARCEDMGYKLLTKKSEYTDVKMNIQFICPKHGKQEMVMDNLIRGHCCFECSYDTRSELRRLDKNFVNSIISTNNNVWLNPDEYLDSTTHNLKIRCSCGCVYETSFSNYYRKGINRCHKCASSISYGEMLINEYLVDHNIKFVREKRFADCKDKKPLPFDFYIEESSQCIEFDGQHHYRDIIFDGQFEIVSKHDMIKDEYCKEHGIELIRIPYWEIKNINSILDSKIIV